MLHYYTITGDSTPRVGAATPVLGGMTPGQTPLRDQLSINDIANEEFETEAYQRMVN